MIEILDVTQIYNNKTVEQAIGASLDSVLFFYNVAGVTPVKFIDNLDFDSIHEELLKYNSIDIPSEIIREYVENLV